MSGEGGREDSGPKESLPRGLHALTAIHALGSVVCAVLSVGSAASPAFRQGLARTGGSRLMLSLFGAWTWAFLLFVAVVLATLACGSWRRRRYAWPMTLVVYSVGVAGSLWQVSLGIQEAWASAAINAGVVAYASRRDVGRAYGWRAEVGADRFR